MDKEQAKLAIQKLVDKYEEVLISGKIKTYTEEDTKKGFIVPMFTALGWDMEDRDEVSSEEHISGDRVDYGFYINSRPKFYLEAKPLKADLNDAKYARQAIKYSWNKGVIWAVLTEFKTLKVFNADFQSEELAHSKFFELSYDKYVEDFERLWLLSKESFENRTIDKKAEEWGKAIKRVSVTESLYKDLTECRKILTEAIKLWNENVSDDDIDEGVQKLLNRLVFIRVLEDREIEPHLLKNLIREWEAGKYEKSRPPLYGVMVKKFRELDDQYNSNLFKFHFFEKWEEHDNKTKKVIDILYGKSGYYEYDFKIMPADVLGAVYENYLGYKLAQSKKGLTSDKDAKKRKEHGIYYTPEFVVDYIVKNALRPVLQKCQTIDDLMKIKVLDPACGSGSFLIKAVEAIYQRYYEMNFRGSSTYKKLQIIAQNIYGVDLDSQAVEIARLNLLINAVEEKAPLPSLTGNIKNGNSLISDTDKELEKYFGKDWREKKPFNWSEEFPEVFKQGGFDVVIGNPPYLDSEEMVKTQNDFREYAVKFYKSAKGNWDLFCLFIEQGLRLLKKEGYLSLIVPNKLLSAKYAEATRQIMLENKLILLRDYSNLPVFEASVYPIVFVVEKTTNIDRQTVSVIPSSVDPLALLPQKKEISQKTFVEYKNGWAPALSVENGSNFFEKIVVGKHTIGSDYIVSGAATVGEAYEIKKIVTEHEEKKKSLKLINTGTIDEYISLWGMEPTRYLKDSYKKPVVDSSKLKNLYPKRFEDSTTPKIIVAGMTKHIEAFFDINGEYLAGKSTVIIKGNQDQLKFLLALLNSKIFTALYNNMFSSLSLQGGYLRVGAPQIKQMPIPVFDKSVLYLVDKMLQLNKELQSSTENSEKWIQLKSEIEKTDKEIDQKVYELYGLIEEEIKIVEGNNKN